jgi:hypothetical protein
VQVTPQDVHHPRRHENGQRWPVMSRNRKSKVVLHIDANRVYQDLPLESFDVAGWACSGGKFVASGRWRSIRCASKSSKLQIPVKVVP